MIEQKDLPYRFSWEGYRCLIDTLRNAGYQVKFFSELTSPSHQLVVRHDIDFSVAEALNMARLEAEIGVKAHYYFLVRTEFYNLCSPTNWEKVKEIISLGHDVGLHFDASLYAQDIDSLERAAARECEVLEAIVECPVTSISFHRPSESLLGLERQLAGRQHAYEPRFFSDIAYVADSQGRFRFGHPLDHEAFAQGGAMQLVIHPIWWRETERAEKMELLDDFIGEKCALIRSETIANCKPYKPYLCGTK